MFAERGHTLYLVGGSVRDAVLGRLGNDLDFTTDARPEVVQELMRGWADHLWDTGGLAFGTVSAAKDDQQLEITTFRADTYDRVSRNPEVTFGDTLEGDLVRRDFTVNAMAVKIAADGSLEFVDPLDGIDALLEGVLDTLRRRRIRSTTIRCACCGPRASSPNWDSRWRRGCGRRSSRWPIRSTGSPQSGCAPNSTS